MNSKKFLITIFSHRPYFVCLFCLSLLSEIGYITYRPMTLLLTKNLYFRKKFIHYTFFYSVRPLYTTSQNIWGDGRMDRPPPQILGTVPQSPISLRPCLG